MSNRRVGTFRGRRAHGASVRMPAPDRQGSYALLGRVLVALLGLGLSGLAAYGVVDAYHKVNAQKIATVQIEGALHYVSEAGIKDSVGRFVSASLVAIDLDLLKAELETQPWIHRVAVRREWPDRLVITVEEEQAIARWNEDGLLNQQGRIFTPPSVAEHGQLPKLTGPAHSEESVMRQYQQFNQLLYPLGVRIRELMLNERGAWTMILTNGIEVRLGRDAVLERLRRLVAFLGSEHGRDTSGMAAIDLRYPNGIAVAPKAQRPTAGGEVVAR